MKKKKIVVISLITAAILIVLSLSAIFIVKLFNDKENERKKAELLEQARQYTIEKLEKFQQENSTKKNVQVVFLGDSLTDGYDLDTFFPQYVTANRGISGDTTFTLEERLKVSAFDINPKVVVMLIGANNIDTMFDNYENILIKLKENLSDSKIVLLSLSAMSREWGRKNDRAILNNQKIKSLSVKHGCVFVDIFTPLCNPLTGEIFDEYTVDGGHWTKEGYQVVTDTLTPVLENLLND